MQIFRKDLTGVKYIIALLILTTMYVLLLKINPSFGHFNRSVTLLWPPAGLALAILLIFGYRMVPAIFFGAIIGSLPLRNELLFVVFAALSNSLEALTIAYFLTKFAKFKDTFEDIRSVISFVVFSIIGAFIGAIVGALGNIAAYNTFEIGGIFMSWYLGDLLGILIVAPPLIILANNRKFFEKKIEIQEVILFSIFLFLMFFAAFLTIKFHIFIHLLAWTFLFPLFTFCLFRFGSKLTFVYIFIEYATSLVGITYSLGIFHHLNKDQDFIFLAFNLSLVATFFIVNLIFESRRKTLEAIKESEKKYKNLFEENPDAIIIFSDMEIKFVNKEAVKLLEADNADKLIGKPILGIVHPEFKGIAKKRINNILKSKKKNELLEEKFITVKGNAIDVEVAAFPIEIDNKIGGQVIFRSILKRKAIEKEVIKLSQGIRQSPTLVVITDTDGNIEYANPRFSEVTGYSTEEIIGKNPRFLKSGETPMSQYKEMWGIITNGDTWKGVFHNKKKNGELYWDKSIIFAIKDKDGNIINYIGIKEDITGLREKEKELENYRKHLENLVEEKTVDLKKINQKLIQEIEQKEKAEKKVKLALKKEREISELKTQFISTVSHEFRTPLTSIFSSIDLLEMFGNNWTEEKRASYFNQMRNSVHRLTGMLDDVLKINRMEKGKLKINYEEVNLINLIKDIVKEADTLLTTKHKIIQNINLVQKEYYLDREIIRTVLINLLSNAIKYSPKGGNIELILKSEEFNLLFCVKDTGIGMSERDLKNIFSEFYRADETSHIQGTGLGLSIVKSLMDKIGGKITVTSKLSEGTTFTVKIPFLHHKS